MKTHNGTTLNPHQLNQARKYAASINRRYAKSIELGTCDFASHITREAQLQIAKREHVQADAIEAGECDHNFTIWQRMNYFITGESVAFLPK